VRQNLGGPVHAHSRSALRACSARSASCAVKPLPARFAIP
jgi:hypothetical protein